MLLPTTTRPARERKPAAAATTPFSASAARLIEQIQAEAREQLLIELSAKDSITVLHGFDPATKRLFVGHRTIEISDNLGNSVTLHRKFEEPESWRDTDYMHGYWQPYRWFGSQIMVDQNGNQWTKQLSPLVCDDFGNLVQVES